MKDVQMHIVILSQNKGVTKYSIRRHMDLDELTQHSLLDPSNKFMSGMYLHYNTTLNQYRVRIGDIPIAQMVAQQQPSSNLERIIVDHANGDSMDSQMENLHWVTSQFNSFNNKKQTVPESGFYGMQTVKKLHQTVVGGQNQGLYNSAKTAALVYNLVVRLTYTDMVKKARHLLNQVELVSRTSRAFIGANGFEIDQINEIFVVVFEAQAQTEAAHFISKLLQMQREQHAKWQQKEEKARSPTRSKELCVKPLFHHHQHSQHCYHQ